MNFSLRPWALSDLDTLVNFANNKEIAKFMNDKFPHPYTKEAGKQFIEYTLKDEPRTIFAIDVNGQSIGGIGIHPQTDIQCKNAELGYWLAEPFWGKGIITGAIIKMLDYGFTTFDITRVFARPFATNAASQHVLEKTGFILEAKIEKALFKNGEFIDELIYAVRRENFISGKK